MQRTRLDRQLAVGVDPAQSTVLSLRARQLQNMRLRRSLARELSRDIEMTEGSGGRDKGGPINREEVIRARSLLLALIERLREPGGVSPQAVAMMKLLLSDASSPIFSPQWSTAKPEPRALERQARKVLAVFDGRTVDPPAGDRPQR